MSRSHLSARLAALAFSLVAAAPAAHAQDASTSLAPASITALAAARADARPAPDAELATPLRAAPVAATRAAGSTGLVATDAAFREARAREAGHEIMRQARSHNGKVYMIVGAAAFIAGAVIGDDAGTIIMVGGAGLGLYGLYLYMQ